MRTESLLILSMIASVLTFASLGGFLLRISVRDVAAMGVVENLNTRIKAWWWIVLLIGSAVIAGRGAVIAVFAVISFIALREFLTLTAIGAADRPAVLASFLIILPLQYTLIALGRDDWFAGFVPLVGLMAVPILTALTGRTRNYLARTAELLWGLVICVYGISQVPALLMFKMPGDQDRQLLLMVFLILISQTSDVFQYVWGKLAGRHKIAPEISPLKTLEGLIGGVASATFLGACLWRMTPFTPFQSGVMSFLIAIAGFLGGLVMSAIKRDRGVKDWGHFIPGHGGMLDRVDSICFSAPMFYHLARWLLGGQG
jgi:phosphatidate cytidylyltransferase